MLGNEQHIYGWCLQTLSTQLRELDALKNAASLDLFHSLKGITTNYNYLELGPKAPLIDSTIFRQIQLDKHYHNFLKSKFTESQRNAIYQSATSTGITLIQGPPGTGKTYTLHALMNTNQLHYSNVYRNRLLKHIWGNMDIMRTSNNYNGNGSNGSNGGNGGNGGSVPKNGREWWNWLERIKLPKKPSILLVAPSNMAVDHLYKAIKIGKFCSFDQAGNRHQYEPYLVRIGKGGNDKTIDDGKKNNKNKTEYKKKKPKMFLETKQMFFEREITFFLIIFFDYFFNLSTFLYLFFLYQNLSWY